MRYLQGKGKPIHPCAQYHAVKCMSRGNKHFEEMWRAAATADKVVAPASGRAVKNREPDAVSMTSPAVWVGAGSVAGGSRAANAATSADTASAMQQALAQPVQQQVLAPSMQQQVATGVATSVGATGAIASVGAVVRGNPVVSLRRMVLAGASNTVGSTGRFIPIDVEEPDGTKDDEDDSEDVDTGAEDDAEDDEDEEDDDQDEVCSVGAMHVWCMFDGVKNGLLCRTKKRLEVGGLLSG